jgi:hypothetical protein
LRRRCDSFTGWYTGECYWDFHFPYPSGGIYYGGDGPFLETGVVAIDSVTGEYWLIESFFARLSDGNTSYESNPACTNGYAGYGELGSPPVFACFIPYAVVWLEYTVAPSWDYNFRAGVHCLGEWNAHSANEPCPGNLTQYDPAGNPGKYAIGCRSLDEPEWENCRLTLSES